MKKTLQVLTLIINIVFLMITGAGAQAQQSWCILDDATGTEFSITETEPGLASLRVVGASYYQDYPAEGTIFHVDGLTFGFATYETQQVNGTIQLQFTIDNVNRRASMQVTYLGQHFYYQDNNTLDSVCDGLPPVTVLQLTITGTPLAGVRPLNVRFTATANDPDGISLITWTFGDGTPTGTGSAINHTFTKKGTFTVTCRATDRKGTTATKTLIVKVS